MYYIVVLRGKQNLFLKEVRRGAYSSRLLFREHLFFWPIVGFVVLGTVSGVLSRRVSRYAGTDVRFSQAVHKLVIPS
jgi:hypothetical protein